MSKGPWPVSVGMWDGVTGWIVWKTDSHTGWRWYVKYYRNGEFVWTSDKLYAKGYSLKTAQKHLKKVIKEVIG